jgi:ATP-dependent Clp protease ATP-binding subunit ClpA
MFKKLGVDTRRTVLTAATEEALSRGDRRVGTDHLLLAVLREDSSPAAHAVGVSLEAARAASDELDRAALQAVGVDPGSPTSSLPPARVRGMLPLTSGARSVLKHTIEQGRPRTTSRIDSCDFVLALLRRDRPDPAAELLRALGVDASEVRRRVAASRAQASAARSATGIS